MLPVRLGIFVGVAALCLWGLFSLLDSLKAPGLLRTEKAVVVKGCDSLDSAEAREQCPPLFCQKALLDAKLVPLTTTFAVTLNRRDEEHLIAGTASHAAGTSHFLCELAGSKVASASLIEASELLELME